KRATPEHLAALGGAVGLVDLAEDVLTRSTIGDLERHVRPEFNVGVTLQVKYQQAIIRRTTLQLAQLAESRLHVVRLQSVIQHFAELHYPDIRVASHRRAKFVVMRQSGRNDRILRCCCRLWQL